MSIKNIEKDLGGFLRDLKAGKHTSVRTEINKILKLGKWHKVRISVLKFTKGMIIANTNGLVKVSGKSKADVAKLLKNKGFNALWKKCIELEIAKFNISYNHILKGTFLIASDYGLIMLEAGKSKALYNFYVQPDNVMDHEVFITKFRNSVQDCWFDAAAKLLKQSFGVSDYKVSHEGQRKYLGSATKLAKPEIQGGVEAAHDRGMFLTYVEHSSQQIQAKIPADVISFDLFGAILKDTKWTWEEDINLTKSPYTTKRAIGVTPGSNKITPYDGQKAIRKLLSALRKVKKDISGALDNKSAAYYKGSVPFAQQVKAAAQYQLMRELMLKNKKYAKVITKVKTKAPKDKKGRPKPLRINLTSAIKTARFSTSEKTAVSKRTEKGQGQEASTSQAADLARLRAYIQSRLPAEVRRNMGRPALRNITGRFSNSVQLISLTQAKATIMAKYTYLLSPYQTFENTGRKRWPMAYNPKLLIAKSIRNLAIGRIQQKITVRRV